MLQTLNTDLQAHLLSKDGMKSNPPTATESVLEPDPEISGIPFGFLSLEGMRQHVLIWPADRERGQRKQVLVQKRSFLLRSALLHGVAYRTQHLLITAPCKQRTVTSCMQYKVRQRVAFSSFLSTHLKKY